MNTRSSISPAIRDWVKDRQTAAGGARSASLTQTRLAASLRGRVYSTQVLKPHLSSLPKLHTHTICVARAITRQMSEKAIARQRARLAAPC